MMKKLALMAVWASVFVAGAALAGGNPVAGKAKSKRCAACHGPDGNSPSPDFPKLAGQNYDYLFKALTDYKAGERSSPIMAPQVANLTGRDMEDLAAYFASQKGLYYKY